MGICGERWGGHGFGGRDGMERKRKEGKEEGKGRGQRERERESMVVNEFGG